MIKVRSLVTAIATLSLAVAAAGCSATEGKSEGGLGDQSAAPEEGLTPPAIGAPGAGRDVSGLTLGPSYTEGALGWHGGGGGGYTGHITPTAVIYAVQTASGSYVDAIRFGWYQPSGADNYFRSGDAWGWTPWYGGGGGAVNTAYYCPAGKGFLGVRGNSGGYLDRVGFICGDANNPNPVSPSNDYSPLWGGGGGGWFGEDKCTSGRLFDSFNIRSGSYVDGLQAICINAH